MEKRITFLLFLFLSFFDLKAQDMPVYNQIFLNPYFYNPALAGKDMRPAIYLWRRQQWTGIKGAPVTNTINFHTIFGNHALFGVNIYSDERSLLKTTTLLVSGGYRLTISDEQSLNFALSAGAGFNSIDLSSIDYTLLPDGDDPTLSSGLDNNVYLDGNAGISYQYNDFYFGLSLPRLFKTKYISSDQFDVGTFGPLNHVVAMTGMKLKVSGEKFAIEPVLIYHYSKNTPNVFEAYGIFHFYNTFWVGAGYRQDSGFSGFVGLNILDHFKFGYSYEVPTQFGNGNPSFSNGSHEFQLAFLIGKKKSRKPKQVRRNFSTKTTQEKTTSAYTYPAQPEKPAETTPSDTLKTGIISPPSEYSTQKAAAPAQVKQKPPTRVKAAVPITKKQTVQTQPARPRIFTPLESMQAKKQKSATPVKEKKHSQKKKKEKEGAKNRPQKRGGQKSTPVPVPADTSKTQVKKSPAVKPTLDKKGKYVGPKHVKRGNHLLELEKGYYVVLGVFSSYEGAEDYSDELFKRGFYTKYGYASETKIYYVYSYHSLHYGDARKESDRLKKYGAKFRENWVLTIE